MSHELKEKLKYHLKQRGYKQQDLADALGFVTSTLSHKWSGKSPWEPHQLDQVADFLELSQREKEEIYRLAGIVNQRGNNEDILDASQGREKHIPLQLPRRVSNFVGREGQVVQILEQLQLGRVVTVCGPGGIGKSALVTEVLWKLAPNGEVPTRFPDGIIYYQFNEDRDGLAFEHIVRSLGEEPKPTPEAAARRVLANRSLLLVLDETEKTHRLPDILDTVGNCGVLVISRRREDTYDIAYRHDIRPLSLLASVRMFQFWGGKLEGSDDELGKICVLLDGVPLAVRLAGSYLSSCNESAKTFLSWLEDSLMDVLDRGEDEHKSILLLLERSIEKLSNGAKHALAALGVLAPTFIQIDAVAAGLGLPIAQVGRALGELVNHSLLDRPAETYEFVHNLIHEYACSHLKAPDDMVEALAAYYIRLVGRQDPHSFDGYVEAHTQAIWQQCSGRGLYNTAQALILTSVGLLVHELETYEPHVIVQAIIASTADPRHASNRLAHAATGYAALGQFELAIQFSSIALGVARKLGDYALQCVYLGEVARAFAQLGDIGGAFKRYDEALTIASEIGDNQACGQLLLDAGDLYSKLGIHEQAVGCYQQGLIRAHAANSQKLMTQGFGDIALAFRALGQYEHAIAGHKQALTLLTRHGTRRDICRELHFLASTYLLAKRNEECLGVLGEITKLYLEDCEYLTHDSIAFMYLTHVKAKEAEIHYQRCIELRPDSAIHSYVSLGVIARWKGDNSKSCSYFEKALAVRENAFQTGLPIHKVLEFKAIALLGLGRVEDALFTLKVAIEQLKAGDTLHYVLYELLEAAVPPPVGIDELVALIKSHQATK